MNARGRRGSMLAELIVAVVLAGVCAAIGGAVLVAAERRTRADAVADRTTQTARDVRRLLAADVEAALPDSIAVRGDTALDLHVHVGASAACVASGRLLVLPGATTAVSGAVPFSVWRQPPEPGDLVIAWDTTGPGAWVRTIVDSVASVPEGAGCGTASGFRPLADSLAHVPVTRLQLAASLPAGVVAGSPVRLFRGARWLLHRGSDRVWTLGYRRCSPSPCGTAQPVAGPLASPADSGLVFRVAGPGLVGVAVLAAGAAERTRFTLVVRGALNVTP
jgi:hypothetical protein